MPHHPKNYEAWTSVPGQGSSFEDDLGGQRMLTTHSMDSNRDSMAHSDSDASQQDIKDGKTKRRVGRPLAYSGDPNSLELEPGQRRVILRRIANRESARRVRARRQDELDKMSQKAQAMDDSNALLHARLKASEAKQAHVMGEVADLKGHLRKQTHDNEALRAEVASLKRMLVACQGEQPVQSDVVLVNRMDWPPLLINPSTTLMPFQQAHDIPKPLNKPNTPTGQPPHLLSAFSEESARLLSPFQRSRHAQTVTAERSFSDILQDINFSLH